MGIDHSDDADVPSHGHSDGSADRADTTAGGGGQADGAQIETRDRHQCYDDLRAAAAVEERTEPGGRSEARARSKAGERAENGQQAKAEGSWEETAKLSRWMWSEYQRKWPPEERAPVERSNDPPGSWRGDGGRFLDAAVNDRIEAECDRIVEREHEKISPALRDTESCDPDRHLIGFEDRLKGRDRIKEKVYLTIKQSSHSPENAVSLVADAVRYTFQYEEARYVQGVRADVARLQDRGFELDKLKNSWINDQYKGINSQWVEPGSGQRFEIQFHTRISFEAKQLTHGAYERLRTRQADMFEEMVLEAFQTKVTAEVPIPPGAPDIPDYPKRGRDAR